MMDGLREWVKSLVLLVLVGTCLELAIPTSSYRGYVRMVMGLLLTLAMLGPALSISGRPVLLDLPDLTFTTTTANRAVVAPPAPQRLQNAQAALTADLYRRRVVAEATAAAQAVPGVAAATAVVQLGAAADGAPPPILAVQVAVAAAPSAPAPGGGTAPASGPAAEFVRPVTVPLVRIPAGATAATSAPAATAPSSRLTAAVAQAVATRLAVAPDHVTVTGLQTGGVAAPAGEPSPAAGVAPTPARPRPNEGSGQDG